MASLILAVLPLQRPVQNPVEIQSGREEAAIK